MMLDDIMAKLCEIEEGVHCEDEIGEFSLVRSYRFLPAAGQALETPCFAHGWEIENPLRIASQSPNGYRTTVYVVSMQGYFSSIGAESDIWSRRASIYFEALKDALAANLKLEDPRAQVDNLRGSLGPLEWNGLGYVGLDLLLDVRINDEVLVGV